MKRYIKSSDLGKYVGGRLLTSWTVSLLVYGAEESEDCEFEQTVNDVYFNEALEKLKHFQEIIDDNHIDGYLTLEDYNSDYYYEGDYDQICEQLEADGLL